MRRRMTEMLLGGALAFGASLGYAEPVQIQSGSQPTPGELRRDGCQLQHEAVGRLQAVQEWEEVAPSMLKNGQADRTIGQASHFSRLAAARFVAADLLEGRSLPLDPALGSELALGMAEDFRYLNDDVVRNFGLVERYESMARNPLCAATASSTESAQLSAAGKGLDGTR